MKLETLLEHMDQLFRVADFSDYCPNGLQVEGRAKVETIVTGVTASQALLDAAITRGADLILVHHGYFWKGEAQPLVGIKKQRVAALLKHDISLVAYHLPLDAHPELGNNAELGRLLGFEVEAPLNREGIGCLGRVTPAMSADRLCQRLEATLQRTPLHIDGGPPAIERVAWCTGAAQGYIEQAAAAGADAYISGEISEQTVHLARELGIHYFAAGHHATERYGVQALGRYLATKYGVRHEYIEIDNPV